MRPLIILGVTILIPFIIGFIFRKISFPWIVVSYLFITLAIFFEPIIIIKIDDYMNPPPPGFRCGTPQGAFMIGFWMLGFPFGMIAPLTVNWLFRREKNTLD